MHYFAPGVACGERAAHEIPAFKRVLSAGPWYACNSVQGGKSGTLIMQAPTDQVAPHTEGWRECSDGLLYLSDKTLPTTAQLVKEQRRAKFIDIVTSQGVTLSIPVSSASARKVSFGTGKFGNPADEFGIAAFAFYDLLSSRDESQVPKIGHPATLHLIVLAIQQFYRVTEELLDDLGWISSADFAPIIDATLGINQSKTQAAGVTSRSPAAA